MMNTQITDDGTLTEADRQRALSVTMLDHAKWWWGVGLAFRCLVVVGGLLSVAYSVLPLVASVIAALFVGAGGLCKLRSDKIRSIGEDLGRRLDMYDGFGWKIPRTELSDAATELSANCYQKTKTRAKEPYFASQRAQGATKALENLQESAWFSKHLSYAAGQWCVILASILVVVSMVALMLAIATVNDFGFLESLGRIVVSLVMLIFSVEVIPLAVSYFRYSKRAGVIEGHAVTLLGQDATDAIPAVQLWSDYHVARNRAPPIPTWLWLLRRLQLNMLWKEYRA